MTTTLCGEMRSFKPYPNERDSVKQTRERCKKPCNFEQKIPMKKTRPTTHWYFFKKNSRSSNVLQNLFPPKGSLVNAPQKKKKGGKKSKRSGEGRKQKVKDERAAKLSRKKTDLEILLSAHARTLKAVIWHQEQKLV